MSQDKLDRLATIVKQMKDLRVERKTLLETLNASMQSTKILRAERLALEAEVAGLKAEAAKIVKV